MRSDKRRHGRLGLLVATLIVVALLVFDRATGVPRAAARDVAIPLWGAAHAVEDRLFQGRWFSSRAELAAENAALTREIAALREQLAAAAVVESENAQLRALMHLASRAPGVAAPVLSSYKASPYGTFLIGVGQADGVVGGALVFSADGFLMGRVVETTAHRSLVSEIFAPGASVDVIAGTVPLTLQGGGGGNAIGKAPRDAAIATGTPVLAPALGAKPVGVILKLERSLANAATTVYVRTPVNLATLTMVYVQMP